MSDEIRITPQIKQLLTDAPKERGAPVVALESALITHGFPRPANLEIALQMQAAVQEAGGVPATIAVLDGEPRIGLEEAELARLAEDERARKVSVRDLPIVLARGENGGTTVAATAHMARRAGIHVFATGGIGGVHRGHPEDVSADLPTLASTPIVVVCAGAKAILDLPRTLEYLETHGTPVLGWKTDEFPAFYSRRSGLRVDARVDTPEEVAQMVQARSALGLPAALLVCAPVPVADEFPAEAAEHAIAQAVDEAERQGISGKALTPFLLARLVELSDGRTRQANEALLLNNARTAALIAQAL